jgi:hypothetical protein
MRPELLGNNQYAGFYRPHTRQREKQEEKGRGKKPVVHGLFSSLLFSSLLSSVLLSSAQLCSDLFCSSVLF